MTTSEYLLVQQDLLIAFRLMRRARVEEFVRQARELAAAGRPLLDRTGLPVATEPERMVALGEAVVELLDQCGREVVPRKAAAVAPAATHKQERFVA